MQYILNPVLAVVLLTTTCCEAQPARRVESAAKNSAPRSVFDIAAHQKVALEHLEARVATGTADPVADAADAVQRREFGLIGAGQFRMRRPTDVICFTPGGQAPEMLAGFESGDAITKEVGDMLTYAGAYNRVLVEHPDFPYPDLCRPRTADDAKLELNDLLVGRGARAVSKPITDLHQAARRGTAQDVRRLLKSALLDNPDGLGMTALAWAAARDNRPAIDLLLSAGADPWAGDDQGRRSAIYWAAALGHGAAFKVLRSAGGHRQASWSAQYLAAAASGGDLSVVKQMLADPHEALRVEYLRSPLPSAAVMAPILKAHPPGVADALLLRAVNPLQGIRLDLMQVALAHGANPNAKSPGGGQETALGSVSTGIYAETPQAVALLLKSGADPNLISWTRHPVWIAVSALTRDGRLDEFDQRAQAIFSALVAAGADLKLPDDQGRPPIWFLLFPARWAPEQLDASYVTPQLLEMLIRSGMDINANWRGKTVLPLVEAQAGKDSELATALRKLGAR